MIHQHGIILDSFESVNTRSGARSNTTVLVKNIPYGTSTVDLQNMFGMHGEVTRLLLPPAGTMAVVEYEHADEARKAFKGLAYKRLANAIMYLEWAPTGLFRKDGERGVDDGVKPVTVLEQRVSPTIKAEAGELPEKELVPDSTLFVKNLSFNTTAERLISAFKGLAGFAFARVNTKPDPKNPGARLSMGYGFVGFNSVPEAETAVKTMQNFVLDGHALLVKFAARGTEDDTARKGGSASLGKTKSAKMIVKNVPFEATKKDIRELFG